MGVIVSPPLSNAWPNGLRASPPSALMWQVLQPSTAGLRNGSFRYICRNCGIANAGALDKRKTTIMRINRVIGPPRPVLLFTFDWHPKQHPESKVDRRRHQEHVD